MLVAPSSQLKYVGLGIGLSLWESYKEMGYRRKKPLVMELKELKFTKEGSF
jgi:hypothetical protein